MAYTLPLLTVAAISGLDSASGELAALGIVVGRGLYGPLYYTGIPYARLVGFGIGTLSTISLLVILAMNS